jgi:hypothetical protein
MSKGTTTELARINGRRHAAGWHAQRLQESEGRTMADLFLDSTRDTAAFDVPAEAVRIHRGRVFYRFADGSEVDFPHVRPGVREG